MTSPETGPLPAPTAPLTQANVPPPSPIGAPPPGPGQVPYSMPGPSAPRRGWPGSAKVVAAVLAVTTLGAAAAGVVLSQSAKSDTKDVKKELATAQQGLEQAQTAAREAADAAKAETKRVQDEVKRVQADLSDAEGKLSDAQAQRDAEAKKAEALRQLFPVDVADFDKLAVQGSYTVTVNQGSAVCTGYANNASACADASFPASLEIGGDAQQGLTASSPYFDTVNLNITDNAGRLTGSGDVLATAADVCNGVPSPTTFTITIGVGQVDLDSSNQLDPKQLNVVFSMGAEASTDCTATSRSAQLTAVAV